MVAILAVVSLVFYLGWQALQEGDQGWRSAARQLDVQRRRRARALRAAAGLTEAGPVEPPSTERPIAELTAALDAASEWAPAHRDAAVLGEVLAAEAAVEAAAQAWLKAAKPDSDLAICHCCVLGVQAVLDREIERYNQSIQSGRLAPLARLAGLSPMSVIAAPARRPGVDPEVAP